MVNLLVPAMLCVKMDPIIVDDDRIMSSTI